MLSSCWTWKGPLWPNGYGLAQDEAGRNRTVHRMAYEVLVGPVPDGLDLDHLCRNKPCYNPQHLEPVTRQENTRRGLSGDLVTHCPMGHEYDGPNTYIDPEGHRRCRTCNRTRWVKRSGRQLNGPGGGAGLEPTAAVSEVTMSTEEA